MKLPTIVKVICFTLVMTTSNILEAQTLKRKSVAILIFDGVQIIDYTGPYEVFGLAGYTVFTVSEKTDPIITSMNMKVIPTYSLETSPQADILVIPGGNIPHDISPNHHFVLWIKKQEQGAGNILSVCNGTFALGATGLLENKHVTTNAGMIDHLSMYISNITPVYDKRFVQDGKIISAGGLSAGIDAALYIVSMLDTEGRARQVANTMEYNWDPEGKYVRTKLVDWQLSKVLDFNPPLRGKTLIYAGDETRWTASYEVTRQESLEQFAGQLESMAMARGWKKLDETKTPGKISSRWKTIDYNKREWELNAEFSKLENNNQYSALFKLEAKI